MNIQIKKLQDANDVLTEQLSDLEKMMMEELQLKEEEIQKVLRENEALGEELEDLKDKFAHLKNENDVLEIEIEE